MKFPECLTQTKWIAILADNQNGENTVKMIRWLAANAMRHNLGAAEVLTGFLYPDISTQPQLKPGGAAWLFVWQTTHSIEPEMYIKSIQGKTPTPDRIEYVTYYPEHGYSQRPCLKLTTMQGSDQKERLLPQSLITDLLVQLKLAQQSYMQYSQPNGQFGHMAVGAISRNHWSGASFNQEQYQEFIDNVDDYISENL